MYTIDRVKVHYTVYIYSMFESNCGKFRKSLSKSKPNGVVQRLVKFKQNSNTAAIHTGSGKWRRGVGTIDDV